MGLWVVAGAFAAQYLTGGHVPDWYIQSWPSGRRLAARLVAAGLWEVADDGWQFHEWDERQPSKEDVQTARKANARRQQLFRSPQLKIDIRERDNDECRYCGRAVRWADRRGDSGGTFDHVDPDGPNTLENLVVCCRGCNTRKGHRTPEQAGMVIRSYLVTTKLITEPQLGSNSTPTQPSIQKSSKSSSPTPIAAGFEEFWAVYPRRIGKRGAEQTYTRALKRATADVILAGAVRYRDDPNREDEFTKHPSTWLNQDCWMDEPLPPRKAVGKQVLSAEELRRRDNDPLASARFR